MALKLREWRPLVKGALRGFATVELPCGLKVRDCPVFAGKDGAWASFPAKPQLDREGRQRVNADGKAAYSAILEWRTRELADQFSAAVVALVRSMHPEALDNERPS